MRTNLKPGIVRTAITMIPCIALLFTAGAASADEIEVDGAVLRGTIDAISADGVAFTPEFTKSSIAVPFAEIDAIRSDSAFLVLYGEDGEANGKLLGIDDGSLLVGDDAATATRVDIATVYSGFGIDGSLSRLEKLRSQWRYWTAAFDAGFALTNGTTDTSNTALGFRSERRKPGTRFLLGANYLLGTEKQKGQSENTLNNEVHGNTKAEYDLTPKWLLIGAFDAEYDEIERLSYRFIPKAGIGYRLHKSDKGFFQLEGAPAYVGERFFGGEKSNAFAVSFGAEGEYELPYSALLAGRAEYLPAVDDWGGDYLLRSEISLTMPIVSLLNFRAVLADQYDSTPAAGNDYNELQVTLGLSVVF
jgi:hypothetical protein